MWLQILNDVEKSLLAVHETLLSLQEAYGRKQSSYQNLPDFSLCYVKAWELADGGLFPDRWLSRVNTAIEIIETKIHNLRQATAREDPGQIAVIISGIRSIEPDFKENLSISPRDHAELNECALYFQIREVRNCAQKYINAQSQMGYESSQISLARELRQENPWKIYAAD